MKKRMKISALLGTSIILAACAPEEQPGQTNQETPPAASQLAETATKKQTESSYLPKENTTYTYMYTIDELESGKKETVYFQLDKTYTTASKKEVAALALPPEEEWVKTASGVVRKEMIKAADGSKRYAYHYEGWMNKQKVLLSRLASFSLNVELRFPLQEGEKWYADLSNASDKSELEYQIIRMDAAESTPAGSFQNVVIVEQKNILTDEILWKYYAPDVGLIKEEKRNDAGVVLTTSTELIKISKN